MATYWELSNLYKKHAVEKMFWTKDGVTVAREEGFRWGEWVCESDERPDIDLDNLDGYCLNDNNYNWEPVCLDDGLWEHWEFPDNMDLDECDRIEDLWNQDNFEAMEKDGWVNDDTEYWVHGPLKLKNVDTGEEYEGKIEEEHQVDK